MISLPCARGGHAEFPATKHRCVCKFHHAGHGRMVETQQSIAARREFAANRSCRPGMQFAAGSRPQMTGNAFVGSRAAARRAGAGPAASSHSRPRQNHRWSAPSPPLGEACGTMICATARVRRRAVARCAAARVPRPPNWMGGTNSRSRFTRAKSSASRFSPGLHPGPAPQLLRGNHAVGLHVDLLDGKGVGSRKSSRSSSPLARAPEHDKSQARSRRPRPAQSPPAAARAARTWSGAQFHVQHVLASATGGFLVFV